MKKLYLTVSSNILVDQDTEKSVKLDHCYNKIEKTYRVPEDCEMCFTKGDDIFKEQLNKGDVVVTFYDNNLPHPYAILRDGAFKENVNKLFELEEERKLKWAQENSQACGKCEEACDACPAGEK